MSPNSVLNLTCSRAAHKKAGINRPGLQQRQILQTIKCECLFCRLIFKKPEQHAL
jgi:hypothetical protein